jgi:hypothetical protein
MGGRLLLFPMLMHPNMVHLYLKLPPMMGNHPPSRAPNPSCPRGPDRRMPLKVAPPPFAKPSLGIPRSCSTSPYSQLGGPLVTSFLTPPNVFTRMLSLLIDSAGRVVHILPCPNFDDFLQSNFLHPCDTFLSNPPNLGYLLYMGCLILQDNNYSQDVPANLSWLPAVPWNPSVLSNPTIVQETPWREVHPYVNARVPPKPVDQGPHRHPNPDGIDFKSINSYHPPIPYAIRGHSSFGSFSPLMTSFDVSIHGGSRDHSFNEGYHHGRHHLH